MYIDCLTVAEIVLAALVTVNVIDCLTVAVIVTAALVTVNVY